MKCNNCELDFKGTICPNCNTSINQGDSTTNTLDINSEYTQTTSLDGIQKVKRGGKLNRNIIFGVISVIILIIALICIKLISLQRETESIKLLNKVYSDALAGGVVCENVGNMTTTIWNNAIFENEDPDTDIYTRYLNGVGGFMDFNDSLYAYFLNGDYGDKIETAKTYSDYINQDIKKLSKIPKKLNEHYSAAKEVRSSYGALLKIVEDPSGNLETFSNNFNDSDQSLSDACDDLKYLLEDLE